VGLPASGYAWEFRYFRLIFPMTYRDGSPNLKYSASGHTEWVEPYKVGAFGFGLRLAVDDGGTDMTWHYRPCAGRWAYSGGVQTFTTAKTAVEERHGWEDPRTGTMQRGQSSPGCIV